MTGESSAMPSRPELVRTFTADEPFWFVIRDNAKGEILFAGRYETAVRNRKITVDKDRFGV